MEQVIRMVEAGVTLATAIKEALAAQPDRLTVESFAAKYALNPSVVSATINGAVRPSDTTLSALIAEFGGTTYEWRLRLWESARPVDESAPALPVRQMVGL